MVWFILRFDRYRKLHFSAETRIGHISMAAEIHGNRRFRIRGYENLAFPARDHVIAGSENLRCAVATDG
jgi:hypothetical protein